jgi:hypothetical protein
MNNVALVIALYRNPAVPDRLAAHRKRHSTYSSA